MTEPARPVVWISHRGGEPGARGARPIETGCFIVIDRQAGLRCATCEGWGPGILALAGQAVGGPRSRSLT